jgi:hypothetical protein
MYPHSWINETGIVAKCKGEIRAGLSHKITISSKKLTSNKNTITYYSIWYFCGAVLLQFFLPRWLKRRGWLHSAIFHCNAPVAISTFPTSSWISAAVSTCLPLTTAAHHSPAFSFSHNRLYFVQFFLQCSNIHRGIHKWRIRSSRVLMTICELGLMDRTWYNTFSAQNWFGAAPKMRETENGWYAFWIHSTSVWIICLLSHYHCPF